MIADPPLDRDLTCRRAAPSLRDKAAAAWSMDMPSINPASTSVSNDIRLTASANWFRTFAALRTAFESKA